MCKMLMYFKVSHVYTSVTGTYVLRSTHIMYVCLFLYLLYSCICLSYQQRAFWLSRKRIRVLYEYFAPVCPSRVQNDTHVCRTCTTVLIHIMIMMQMKEAFTKQLANEDYQRFLGKVPRVEGVWDDHDYGGERRAKTAVEQISYGIISPCQALLAVCAWGGVIVVACCTSKHDVAVFSSWED